jgi:assimilatory nitrate reductase catalytic subunit
MLAAHFEIGNPDHRAKVQRFWNCPHLPDNTGLKAVDLFRAVDDGRVKALWIMSTNPADSMPEADIVQAAIAKCPFVVVSDIVPTDTTRHAHVLLPAAGWGEKSGTVTDSERRISRQRPFLRMPGETKPDWQIICEVAKRMGFAQAFGFDSPATIFREHSALSAVANGGTRDLDLGLYADISLEDYEVLAPVQWPQRADEAESLGPRRFFADGKFYTPDRRARFLPTPPPRQLQKNADHPLILNTGRIRDQWHTMTRTSKSARLMSHVSEPYCEIHPSDAAHGNIAADDLVRISNARGSVLARALITHDQRPGSIFVPMHWTDVFASQARVDALARPDADPISGQPGLKSTQVRIEPFPAAWHGFAVLDHKPAFLEAEYWALARTQAGWRAELAGTQEPADWSAFAARILGCTPEEILSYRDTSRGQRRFAGRRAERAAGVLFIQAEPLAISRTWLVEASGKPATSSLERLRLLSGRPAGAQPDPGVIVCACFNIDVNAIANAIERGARTVDAIGNAVRAGTNCGSCRSEILRMLPATAASARP